HSTGHPVGLEVHDAGPGLSAGGGELEPGAVVTVEPGLYEPGLGGVRIEDVVVVREDGYENLNSYPKTLQVDMGDEETGSLLDQLFDRLPL
ncbi:MAG: M24 family metallopeptidase, partial [Candidatus Nanohaloarchaea archaeon]|nr:M24 family metallopeptidase [Candidatus Nanohaloarchaea archaeon]